MFSIGTRTHRVPGNDGKGLPGTLAIGRGYQRRLDLCESSAWMRPEYVPELEYALRSESRQEGVERRSQPEVGDLSKEIGRVILLLNRICLFRVEPY